MVRFKAKKVVKPVDRVLWLVDPSENHKLRVKMEGRADNHSFGGSTLALMNNMDAASSIISNSRAAPIDVPNTLPKWVSLRALPTLSPRTLRGTPHVKRRKNKGSRYALVSTMAMPQL